MLSIVAAGLLALVLLTSVSASSISYVKADEGSDSGSGSSSGSDGGSGSSDSGDSNSGSSDSGSSDNNNNGGDNGDRGPAGPSKEDKKDLASDDPNVEPNITPKESEHSPIAYGIPAPNVVKPIFHGPIHCKGICLPPIHHPPVIIIKKVVHHTTHHSSNNNGNTNPEISDNCYSQIKIAWIGKIQRGSNQAVDSIIDRCMGLA